MKVLLRDYNELITITEVGKAPIRGRISSNQYFHTPLELLLSALGLCIGGIINHYCRMNEINPAIFEEIIVDKNNEYKVFIKRPNDFDISHIVRMSTEIENCNIAKELNSKIEIEWLINSTPTPELLKEPAKPCCGQS